MKQVNIENLAEIMRKLRDPDSGCPWDIKQNYQTILPYTIEEVYEVADAIERNDFSDLKTELGDLLFQVVFYAQIAAEDGHFNLSDVIETICEKLTRRHPHVFGDKESFRDKESLDESAINQAWENHKHLERQAKITGSKTASLLDDIPTVLPELKRAQKIQNRVAKQGFDWNNVQQVWDKLAEESKEVKEAAETGDLSRLQDEIGDLLFVCVNLARHYKVDADMALRHSNKKFESRFRKVEQLAKYSISKYSLEELEEFWQEAKKQD